MPKRRLRGFFWDHSALVRRPARRLRRALSVLAYRWRAFRGSGEPPRVLDNIENEAQPLSARPELQVVYEFNSTGLYVPRADGERRVSDVTRLGNWAGMLERKQANAY